jgi:four helix bundle protein
MSDFKKLRVWRKAHALALNARRMSAQLKGADRVALRTQVVRAAMSIPTNIVEGRGQTSPKEFARFLKIALNSSSELEYHLIVARDSGAIDQRAFLSILEQVQGVRMMLHGLLKRLTSDTVSHDRDVSV